jgi:RNA polymerase sigma-70 factor (ECF subfamily)
MAVETVLARELYMPSRMNLQSGRRTHFMNETAPLIDGLYASARRLTGASDRADDLVQDTMLLAWQSWERFAEGTNLRGWLHRIQINVYITGYRRARRERVARDRAGEAGLAMMTLTDAQEAVTAPDGGIQRSGLGPKLRQALDQLPVEFREVVVMADLGEMSYRDIAEALGCPMGTVMSRLHRARRSLARSLTEPAEVVVQRRAA